MSFKSLSFVSAQGKPVDPFLLEAVHRPIPQYVLDMDTETPTNDGVDLPYRTLLVSDGAGTVLECSLTLTDYSARPANDLRERYSSLILTEDQNRRLVRLLESFEQEDKEVQDRATPPLPDADKKFTGGKRTSGEFEVVTAAEQKVRLEGVSPAASKPFRSPTKKAKSSPARDLVVGEKKEESPFPKKAKKRRNLTHRVGPLQDITDPDKEKIPCEYRSGSIQCGSMAKLTHIYCDHHLRVSSMKNEHRKELKRSLSATSFSQSGSADEEYPTFLTLDVGEVYVDTDAAPVIEYWNAAPSPSPNKTKRIAAGN